MSKAFLVKDLDPPAFNVAAGVKGDRQDEEWYEGNNITTLMKQKVTGVDSESKVVSTESGDTIAYDNLVIAVGADAFRLNPEKSPGADLGGIYYLRNIDEGYKLKSAIAEVSKSGETALVVGGGYIGLECTAALVTAGVKVTMVFPEEHAMIRLFTKEMAAWYEEYYESKGVQILKGNLVTGFEGKDGKVTKALLNNDTSIECGMVIVGIGARPSTLPFKEVVEMDKNGGIIVNSLFETSTPGIYAIGDIASFPFNDEPQRFEHVDNARKSAAHCAGVILKQETTPYTYHPYFYSRVFDLSWKFYGLHHGTVITFGSVEEKKAVAFWLSENKLVGAFIESGTDEEADLIMKGTFLQVGIDEESARKVETPADALGLIKIPSSDESRK